MYFYANHDVKLPFLSPNSNQNANTFIVINNYFNEFRGEL